MRTSTGVAVTSRRGFLIAASAAAIAPGAALAQEYPSKTIRIFSPFSPGATSDLVARALGPALATAWGVNVVAENKPGGGGIVGADFVAKANLKAMGMQPIGSTPEDAEKFIRAETAKWGAVIKASGARAE